MPNAYDNCPCGSGKKFKWCCTPYFSRIEHAFELQQNNQHDNAVKEFDRLIMDHPDRPQVYGFYANLLLGEDKAAQADEMLEKAFKIDPSFGMGYLLRGIMRQQEGEIIGALLLFRKAAEAYSVDAVEQQGNVHELIARHEVVLNRPVAARAALERATMFLPAERELREHFEAVYGETSRLPAAAGKPYKYRRTAKTLPTDGLSGKFGQAKAVFQAMTTEVPDDPAAWFNLGLTQAWLGEQPAAVESLNKSLDKEWDDSFAEETAALVEVLRCGSGMENESDYLEHRILMQVRDPEAVFGLLQQMSQARQILAPQMDEEAGVFTCLVIEELPNLLDTGTTMARSLANLSIAQGILRVWHVDAESVRTVAQRIRERLALAVGEPVESVGTAQYADLIQEALAFPVRTADVAAAEAKLRDRATSHFEDVWCRRPLKSLGGAAPLDASGSTLLRKRLLGIIRFLQDCLFSASPRKRTEDGGTEAMTFYDFDRLRHKLGVELKAAGNAPTLHVPECKPAEVAAASAAPLKIDFTAMNIAELAGIDLSKLTVAELEDGMRAAMKLDAREIAVKYAKVGAAKPADAAKPDRYPLFACAITATLADGDIPAALAIAEAGAKDDAANHQGKRASEYGVQNGKLYARSGRILEAVGEFDTLLDRTDEEPRFLIVAVEAMLSAKQPAHALKYVERGLAKAKSSGNRDLEGACLELGEAAKRLQ